MIYVFVDGYLLAGPSRTLLQGAIDTRDSGMGLTTSEGFRNLLPRDGQVNFSGVVYQNLGTLHGPLASLGQAAAQLSPEQAQLANELAKNSRPSMTVA